MTPTAQRLIEALAPRVGYAYIRFLSVTMRCEHHNRGVVRRIRESDGQFILTFWHSRFVMMPHTYQGQRIVVLSSLHRDAVMLGEILRRFGFVLAKGSSSARGALALREILRRVREEGFDVGWTPDGPRGPRRRVQTGVLAAARLSGKPILPVAFSASRARRLRSWDRTLLPFPFSRGLFVYGEPVRVPRDADSEHLESLRRELEVELDRLTDTADIEMGMPPEDPRPEPPG